MNAKKISLIILGAGGRGTIYANLARLMPEKMEISAVAEPREFFRERLAAEHHIPRENVFSDWHEVLKRPKFADGVIICTQDRMHAEPAVAFAEHGYHILVEKPLGVDPDECRRVVEAVQKNHVMLSVCHVMRYANYTRILRDLISRGGIGQIISVEHLEPVGHWRFAHSYVRGNWRREDESSPVLLAKSIHDLDWISYIVGDHCRTVSSFGSRMFFRAENRPEKAADRCLDCPLESECPYSAPRFYLERFRKGPIDNYVESVCGELSEANILKAMREGPYGRCVFACDNDVADHQVVNLEFASGATAVFTLAGCSRYGERRTVIFGSAGEIRCDGHKIELYSYLRDRVTEIDIEPDVKTPFSYHNGGDKGCLESFVDALRTDDPSMIVTGAEVSLETHNMVFAAEISRQEKRTVLLQELTVRRK